MTERPILFQGAMVRAILDGSKTMTRRVVKPVGRDASFVMQDYGTGWWPFRSDDGESAVTSDGNETPHACSYGKRGDRLWVREAWRADAIYDALPPRDIPGRSGVHYEADGRPNAHFCFGKLRPSMFMMRSISRIALEIVDVRVERLQDISEADARAEGCEPIDRGIWWKNYTYPVGFDGKPTKVVGYRTAIESYRSLWEAINGDGSWAANPWVWVVEFRRLS